jgi:hypothetical protein
MTSKKSAEALRHASADFSLLFFFAGFSALLLFSALYDMPA